MPEKSQIRFRHFPYRAGKVKTFRTKKRNTVMKKMNEREVLHMKRIFSNTVTKRLISAFLVLAMVVTIIPVTDAEAKKKYQYKHDFYTVDGRKTDGHREEIINTEHLEGCDCKDYPENEHPYCGKYGLFNCYDSANNTTKDMYAYGMNADEVKQLVAGKTVTIHVDRCRVLKIFELTNVELKELFLEMSYTDRKGKRKDVKDFVEYDDCNGKFELNSAGERDYKDPVITDVDITLRLPSKAVYKKYTRLELPKGYKGKKNTYLVSLWVGTEEQCRNNRTHISAEGIEEPIEYYLGKGKWGYMYAPLGAYDAVSGMCIDDKTIKNGWSFTIRGKYTHRKLTYKVVFTKKRTGKLVYDKFKHESQLGIKDAK